MFEEQFDRYESLIEEHRIRKAAHGFRFPCTSAILLANFAIHRILLAAARKSQKWRSCPPAICDLGAGIHGRHLFQRAESFLTA